MKAAEFKEQVSKILQPEVNRLNLLHEREMGDIEQQANSVERETRELYARRLQQAIDCTHIVVVAITHFHVQPTMPYILHRF